MRILIIEDNEGMMDILREGLAREGFSVDAAEDGDRGSSLARTNDYDLIITDLILPGKTGLQICREVRAASKAVPIIAISVKSDTRDKVALLKAGADDYLTKPFSLEELLARIQALFRRPRVIAEKTLRIDDLTMDISKQSVKRGRKAVYLTRKEFSLLEYLLRHKKFVLSRGMIMEHVWNAESDPFSNTIEAHMLNLRRKIDIRGHKKLLYNVPGRGYKIDIKQ